MPHVSVCLKTDRVYNFVFCHKGLKSVHTRDDLSYQLGILRQSSEDAKVLFNTKYTYVRFDVLTAMSMKVTVFWDDTKLHGVTNQKTVILPFYLMQSDYKWSLHFKKIILNKISSAWYKQSWFNLSLSVVSF